MQPINLGKRQIELERRKQEDEIFRNAMGVHQETVDTYLENLFIESLDSASAIQAKEQVREYAMKIDEISQKWYIFC